MAFTRITTDTGQIAALTDEPALTAAQLKAKFDAAGTGIKTATNALMTQLEADTAAASVGFTSTKTGLTEATTIKAAIEALADLIASLHADE